MRIPFLLFKKELPVYSLVLDIGTEAIKAISFERRGQRNIILGAAIEYFEQFGVFNGRDLRQEILKKTISKVIKRIIPPSRKKAIPVLVSLPPDILKGKTVYWSFERRNPKKIIDRKSEEEILSDILQKSKKEVTWVWSRETGILSEDVHFLGLNFLEMKIDGYLVSSLHGLNGKKLDFKILTIFLPKRYLADIQRIAEMLGLKILEIIHPIQLLQYFLESRVFNSGLLLDIGGRTSQIFLIKEGILEQTDELKIGGETFSQAISEGFGITLERARDLKHRYSKKLLSEEVRRGIREKLWQTANNWFLRLKSRLLKQKTLIPSTIFLAGGGSLLSEIEEILTEGDWETVPLTGIVQVKNFFPEIFKKISGTLQELLPESEHNLNNPQYTLTMLMVYYALQKENF